MESLDRLRDYSEWLDAEVPESEEEMMELEEEKMRARQEIEAAKERGDSDVESSISLHV